MALAISAQSQEPDPFAAPLDHRPASEIEEGPPIFTLLEWIEVDQAQFSSWLLDHPLKTDTTELRREVQEWIEAKENLDFQESSMRLLKGWLFVHIPLTYSLILLGIAHGVIVLMYGGNV